MTTNAVFPAILGFFQRGVIISDTEKGFPAIREMFCSFFPQSPFSKTLSVCHFLLSFFFFCLPFQHSMFFSSTPFEIIFSFCFLGSYLCCPFPFFVSASFLPTSFLPSPSPIHLVFIFGRFSLLFFLFAWYCFQAWRFLLSFSCWFLFGFLLTVVVTFFIIGNLVFVFPFCCFVKQMWRRLFWFQINDIGKRCFPCSSGGFLGKWLISNLGPDVLLVLTLGSWVLKTRREITGRVLALKLWVRCVRPLLTGRGGALN